MKPQNSCGSVITFHTHHLYVSTDSIIHHNTLALDVWIYLHV